MVKRRKKAVNVASKIMKIKKIKSFLLTYSAFLTACFCAAYLYLANLKDNEPVSELISITGPMPLVYILITLSWNQLYFIFTVISVSAMAVMWFLALRCSGIKKLAVGLVFVIFWVLSGLFSLAISYYG